MKVVRSKIIYSAVVGLLLVLTSLSSALISRPASASGGYAVVTFAENDSPTDSVSATQVEDAPTALTLFSNLSPSFSNSGYTFVDWNTQPDGSGTTYANGATYNFDASTILYAIWKSNYQVVTFAENDSPTDSVSATQVEDAPTALTFFANLSPSFSNPGYTFVGWNTEPDGSGVSYGDGASYSFSADLSLYAQWTVDQYAVNYDAEGGVVSPTTASYEPGGVALVLPTPTQPGAIFQGWFTEPAGGSEVGSGGSSYEPVSSITLYARWTTADTPPSGSGSVGASWVVSFDGDGASGSVAAQSDVAGNSITVPSGAGLTFAGYSFVSWNTEANGSGTSYSPGESLVVTTALTLYAQWSPSPSVQIQFVARGGSGSVPTLSGDQGTSVVLPNDASLIRPGYTLSYWSTESDGGGTRYQPGQTITLTSAVTLYAQWAAAEVPTLYGTIDQFSRGADDLSRAQRTQIEELARSIKKAEITKVALYAYAPTTASGTEARRLSDQWAASVATYLRASLKAMGDARVIVSAAGEGVDATKGSGAQGTVEVFVL